MTDTPHGESEPSRRILRGLALAVLLSGIVLAIEGVGAWFSRSLSITVDAAHNIPDLFAFVLSYASLASTARGGTEKHTFGSHRLEVFAALLNGSAILVAGIAFAYLASLGILHGTTLAGPINPAWILFAAVPTLGLRAVAAAYLGRLPVRTRDLNVRSVLLHLASDVAITGALLVDAAVLLVSPANEWVDSAGALVIAGILVYESVPIFRGAWDVLTERVPRGLSLPAVAAALESVRHVQQVHDLHVWAVCPALVCLSAHVQVEDMPVSQCGLVTAELRSRVETQFGIVHAVFELESGSAGTSRSTSGT